MKTGTLVLLGVGALGAWYLLTRSGAMGGQGQGQGGGQGSQGGGTGLTGPQGNFGTTGTQGGGTGQNYGPGYGQRFTPGVGTVGGANWGNQAGYFTAPALRY